MNYEKPWTWTREMMIDRYKNKVLRWGEIEIEWKKIPTSFDQKVMLFVEDSPKSMRRRMTRRKTLPDSEAGLEVDEAELLLVEEPHSCPPSPWFGSIEVWLLVEDDGG